MTRRSMLGLAGAAVSWAGVQHAASACIAMRDGVATRALGEGPVQVPQDFVGMHAHRWPGTSTAPSYDFGAARSHDHDGVAWCEIHRAPGVYVWDALDRWVSAHTAQKRTLIYTLYGTPAWLASRPEQADLYGRPGGASAPRTLRPLADFVTALSERYNADGERRLTRLETWNEPHFEASGQGFWSGSAEELVSVGRTAYQAAKRVDAHVQVLSPGFVGELAGEFQAEAPHLRLARSSPMFQYLAASDGAGQTGAAWCDAIAFHTYNTALSGGNAAYARDLRRIRAMLLRMGVQKPLVNTECGFVKPHPFHELDAAAQGLCLKRLCVVHAALGVQGLFFYSHDDDFVGNPAQHAEIGRAIEAMHGTLAGARLLSAELRPDGSVRFRTDREVVTW